MLISVILLLTVFTLLYSGVIRIGFLSDDFLDLHHSFSTGSFTRIEAGGFRPLIVAVWSFDSAVFGPLHAWGWHLTNILFHLANIVLIWLLLRELGFRNLSLFFGVAFFLLSAVGPPSVARVSGRTTIIAILPLLAGFICHARWLKHGDRHNLVAGMALLLVSLFAKETALAAPLSFGAISLYMRGRENSRLRLREASRDILLYCIPVAIYLLWRAVFGLLSTNYDESFSFGFFMVKNLAVLGAIPWSPWFDGLPVRMLVVLFIAVLALPFSKRLKILFLMMTTSLLLTVSNLPPRPIYAYAALPACAILISGLSMLLKKRIAVTLFILLSTGSFLASRDEVSRIIQASDYVDHLVAQIGIIDEEYPGRTPVFLSGIQFAVAGYGTVWEGSLEDVLETAGFETDRLFADDGHFWEYIYSIHKDNGHASCFFVNMDKDTFNVREFSTASRIWSGNERMITVLLENGVLWIDDSLFMFNSFAIPCVGEELLLVITDPLCSQETSLLEPAYIRGDTAFFDLEGSIQWLLSDPPFSIRIVGQDRIANSAVFSTRRLWLESLEGRLLAKQEHLPVR